MLFEKYSEDDYEAVCDFLIELNRADRSHINWNWARFEWMYEHPEFDKGSISSIGLWRDDKKVVGAAIYDMYFGEGFCGGYEITVGQIPENKIGFIKSTMERISFTIHDPMIRKIRILLVQEQFRGERYAEVTTKHQLLGIQKMYSKILSEMMDRGLIIRDEPEMLALELAGPVVLMVARADREPQLADEILEDIEEHLEHFCRIYMKE